MNNIKNTIEYFDWITCIIMLMISSIGLLFVFSATYTPEFPYSLFFKKQALGSIAALFIYFLCIAVDYRTLIRWGYFGYFGVIGLLIFTLLNGSIGMGGQRWINLIFFKLQPSELAKLLLPAFASYYFYVHKDTVYISFNHFTPVLTILGISFLLILKQPDLGTALIIAFTGLIIIWLAGLSQKFFLYGLIILTISTPILWHTLKPYQKNRIAVFFGQGTTQKERYQIEQATIAIGSGGFFGKGFLNGTQNKFRFLPESRTDFIFAVLCEEWGFLGASFVIFLYLILFIRLFNAIKIMTSPYIQLLAIGLVTHMVLSTIINICMVIGLMPIVGIPLPLMSYGLSNLWVSFASLGWIQGISAQRLHIGEYPLINTQTYSNVN